VLFGKRKAVFIDEGRAKVHCEDMELLHIQEPRKMEPS